MVSKKWQIGIVTAGLAGIITSAVLTYISLKGKSVKAIGSEEFIKTDFKIMDEDEFVNEIKEEKKEEEITIDDSDIEI